MLHDLYRFAPLAVAAAASSIPLLENIKVRILNPLIALLMTTALLAFLYGGAEFVRNAASEDGREKGKQHMLWGIIGLFIMVSAIGLVNFICRAVGAC